MRPQNGKRGRSRGRNKGGNQLNRTLESNGPDVKIRGTAAHIYEKYQSLARDANSAGDRVGAENYLQHAEHYYRLMAAAQIAAGIQPQASSDLDADGDNDGEANFGHRHNGNGMPQSTGNMGDTGDDDGADEGETSAAADDGADDQTAEAAPAKPPRQRRLNGRSRRVQGEGRAPRAIKSLDGDTAEAAEAPANGDEATV